MSGKEAMVYVVRRGGDTLCAKIYKEATNRSFRQAVDYTENRKTKNTRQARAMAKGTRFGRQAQEAAWQSAEVDAREQLQQLCEADRSGRHVACDVVATRNWTLMELGRALQDAADESSKDDASAPAPSRTRNHKR